MLKQNQSLQQYIALSPKLHRFFVNLFEKESKKRQLSWRKMAVEIGVSRSTMYNLIQPNGVTRSLRLDILLAILDYCDTPLSELVSVLGEFPYRKKPKNDVKCDEFFEIHKENE